MWFQQEGQTNGKGIRISDTDAGDLYWSILDNTKKPICIKKPGQQFMFSQN